MKRTCQDVKIKINSLIFIRRQNPADYIFLLRHLLYSSSNYINYVLRIIIRKKIQQEESK